jgi:predicted nucleic acid-binding protein
LIYVDTSLLLAAYAPESGSGLANQILSAHSVRFLSDLVVAELLVGLARKVHLRELTRDQADQIRAIFEKHMQEGYLLRVSLHSTFSEEAGRLAFLSTLPLRTLDAVHLAAAVELGGALATFDRRLAVAARALGVPVVPEAPPP